MFCTDEKTAIPALDRRGEYSGARRDKFLGAAHVERLALATVAVGHLDGKAHDVDARKLVEQGSGRVLENYLAACSIVAGMVHQGDHLMKIGRKTGLGTGQVYGMLRDIGEKPPSGSGRGVWVENRPAARRMERGGPPRPKELERP